MITIKTKRIKSGIFVLEPIHINECEGNKILLIGKNGSGKSFLMKSLVLPNSGICDVFTLNNLPIMEKDIIYVGKLNFQSEMHVRKISKEMSLRAKRWNQSLYLSLINEFGIPLTGTIKTLSLGYQQKLAIAVSLAQEPKILLIDEAFEGIDDLSKIQIFQRVKKCIDDCNGVLILATHKVEGLGEAFDHILHLDSGSVVLNQDVESFKVLVNDAIDYPIAQNFQTIFGVYKEIWEKDKGEMYDQD